MNIDASRLIAVVLAMATLQATWWAPELMNCAYAEQSMETEACSAHGCCAEEVVEQAAPEPEAADPEPCCPGVVCAPFVLALPVGMLEFIAPDRPMCMIAHREAADPSSSFIAFVWRPPNAHTQTQTRAPIHQQQPIT